MLKTLGTLSVLILVTGLAYWFLAGDEPTTPALLDPGSEAHTEALQPPKGSQATRELSATNSSKKPLSGSPDEAAKLVSSREAVMPGGAPVEAIPTRRIEGWIQLPQNTPADEKVSILLLDGQADFSWLNTGRPPETRDLPDESESETDLETEGSEPDSETNTELAAATDSNENSAQSELAEHLTAATFASKATIVAEADSAGRFAFDLPLDLHSPHVAAQGRYLFSEKSVPVPAAGKPLKLSPRLGAWVTGTIAVPADFETQEMDAISIGIGAGRDSAISFDRGSTPRWNKDLDVSSDLEFEFRGVPIDYPIDFETDHDVLARSFKFGLNAHSGEHMQLDLQLSHGAQVHGRVVDQQGDPVPGVGVRAAGLEFWGNPSELLRKAETDLDGRYELSGLTPGKVWIIARHDDFREQDADAFEALEGEQYEIDFELNSGLTLKGQVRFADGLPAPGVTLRLDVDWASNPSGTPPDRKKLAGAGNEAESDEFGAFSIAGLAEGPFAIYANYTHEGDDRLNGEYRAEQFTVSPSSTSSGSDELILVLTPPMGIKGRVINEQGEPVTAFEILGSRAAVQWYLPASETSSEAFEDEEGRFSVDQLRAGEWTFTAVAEGYAPSAGTEIKLPTEQELEITLQLPIVLAGKVVDPGGRPVAGARVGPKLDMFQSIAANQGINQGPETISDEEGLFTLEDLQPGNGSIIATRDGFADSSEFGFDLEPGEVLEDCVLALRKGAKLTGEVYNSEGELAPDVQVFVALQTGEGRRALTTDSKGRFETDNLKPEAWVVQAFLDMADPNDMTALISGMRMERVELKDGEEAHVVLGLTTGNPVQVSGRVSHRGEGVPSAVLSFMPSSGGSLGKIKIAALDKAGEYSITLEDPGLYSVTLQTGLGGIGQQHSMEYMRTVPEGEACELNFELPIGGVSGTVYGPDGAPLAATRVTLNTDGGITFGTMFGGQYTETATDDKGQFELPYLREGAYTLAAGGATLGGAFGDDSQAGREVHTVQITEGKWIDGIDFHLRAAGSLKGVVRDVAGKAVADATIFVRDSEGKLLEIFSMVTSEASGHFSYPGLAPGEYSIVARKGSLSSAERLSFRINDGAPTKVEVFVDGGTTLLISLLDKSDKHVVSIISVVDEEGREMNGMLGLSELMERFSAGAEREVQRVGPLPPGTYTVNARTEDGRSTTKRVTVDGSPERKIKLRLRD